MFVNQRYFEPPELTATLLAARGFDARGNRSGGIFDPQRVVLSPDTLLFRLFADKVRRFGQWWFTGHEMRHVMDYFGSVPGGFSSGRKDGRGILHSVLAVRHEWGSKNSEKIDNPKQLSLFFVARVNKPLLAFYGLGDEAPDATQTRNQKPYLIIGKDGKQRAVRQLFLPKTWEYETAFTAFASHMTDTHLSGAVRTYERGPLYFE